MLRPHIKEQIRDDLYSAFSSVAKPTVIDTCPCCHTDAEIQQLLKGTQRDVPKDLIYALELSWFNTFGNEAAAYYFMPCILDVYLSRKPLLLEEGYTYDLLVRAGLFQWPEAQQKAVKRAYTAICKTNAMEVPDRIRSL